MPRPRRSVVLGVTAALAAGLVLPLLAQTAASPRTAKVEAVVVDLAPDGRPVGVTVNGLLRVYADGEYSVEDGRRTVSGEADGSEDVSSETELELVDGLVRTPTGPKALPLRVATDYKLDGRAVTSAELAGESGVVEVGVTVTNTSIRTRTVDYLDSTTGSPRTIEGVTALPLRVELRGVELPDDRFDSIATNGRQTRDADRRTTELSWTAVLAPPVYPGSIRFTFSADAKDFALPALHITAHPGLADNVPKPVKDALDKGGATAATLRGFVNQFGDGYGELDAGLQQVDEGIRAIVAGLQGELKGGLENRAFDPALYAEDSTLASNQPGLGQALDLLADGLALLKANTGTARAAVASGRLDRPGLKEGLQLVIAGLAGVPGSSDPNVRAGLLDVQSGVAGVIGGLATLKAGLVQLSDGIGVDSDVVYDCDGNLGTTGDVVTDPITCPNPNTVTAVPTSQSGALSLVYDGILALGAGVGGPTDVVYDCDGDLSTTADIRPDPGLCADPNLVQPVPTSLAGGLTVLKEGIDRSAAAIGSDDVFDCNGDGAPDPYGAACNEGVPGAVPLTMQSAIAQVRGAIDVALATLGAAHPLAPVLGAARAGLGEGNEFDCAPYDGAPDDPTSCPASARPLSVQATAVALREGSLQAAAALGAGSEFDCAPYDGTPDDPAACPATARPLTARATVAALAAGIGVAAEGVGAGTEFDCTGDGVADMYGAACNEGVAGANPLSVRATSRLFKASVDGLFLPGIGDLGDAPTASLLGALGALDAGLPQLVDGLDEAVNGTRALVDGTDQLAAGLGTLQADGSATKAVTSRVSRFGNTIESPASVLWGIQSAEDTIRSRFVPGVDEILAALGDPSVPGSTVLAGLQQLVDGVGQAREGTAAGETGAAAVANTVEKSALSADVLAALQLAGINRATTGGAFLSAPEGARVTVMFLFNLESIG